VQKAKPFCNRAARARRSQTAPFGRREGSCLTAAKGANSFPLERVDFSSRFRVEFPISGTAGNLSEALDSARELNFANFLPSRNRLFHSLRNWSGISLALHMHKEKNASESNQYDLAVNNLTTDQSITYGKHNNALPVCRSVNQS
jgi:hypothetical protein